MTAMTVNSFPSLNNWNSPRAWALAIIVLLHLGFLYALTHGMSINPIKILITQPPQLLPLPAQPQPVKNVIIKEPDLDKLRPDITVVKPDLPVVDPEPNEETQIFRQEPTTGGQEIVGPGSTMQPIPTLVEPRIDARRGLSEPYFPPDVIRRGGEGTVLLSLYILADGRVGEVKLISSSGHTKLDDSAMREAKKWRFIPGTSDGQPMAMWKQIPVTFRLNTRM